MIPQSHHHHNKHPLIKINNTKQHQQQLWCPNAHPKLSDDGFEPHRTEGCSISKVIRRWVQAPPDNNNIHSNFGVLKHIQRAGKKNDTRAATVVWAMTLLMNNPKSLKKLQEEVRNVGNKGKVDEDDLAKLNGTITRFEKLLKNMDEFYLQLIDEHSDPNRPNIMQKDMMNAIFTFAADPDFLENDIRVKPDLDALGALGDAGWYCTRSILWAADFNLPKSVTALPGTVFNKAGVIISCGAALQWEDGKVATFHCSFLANLTMSITASGTKGSLYINDFVIPFEEKQASFSTATESGFTELVTGWVPLPSKHTVMTDLPQEVLMVTEFSRLVKSIKNDGAVAEKKWPTISRKTQYVLDAVKTSVDKGGEPVILI